MKKIHEWYCNLSRQVQVSITVSISVVGFISTLFTILGVSLVDLKISSFLLRLVIVGAVMVVVYFIMYHIIESAYKDSLHMTINKTPVLISCGDIFETQGWRVIGCDTHFDTRVDDVIISKGSLHGRLVLEFGKAEEIQKAVEDEAKRRNLTRRDDGLYDFPLGSIVQYKSSVDGQIYLMLAMTELDEKYESHTDMAKFERMLMAMWKEVDRVYASNRIVLPILGKGITRFDDGPKDRKTLLRCILCTLKSTGVHLNSEVNIVVYNNADDLPLYEYKDMFDW